MSQLALQLIEKEKAEKKGYLELGNCGLTPDNSQLQTVWEALGELTHLETLILSNVWHEYNEEEEYWDIEESQNDDDNNLLDKIPIALTNLVNLKKLVIEGGPGFNIWKIQQLENLPQNISILNIGDNRISKLENLSQNISILNINNNQISKLENLPQNISILDIGLNQISKLENLPQNISILDIHLNRISKLENLPQNISILNIGYNRISKLENLPQSILTLDISYNPIKDLKPLLPFIKKGIEYDVRGNPLENPPVEIVERGNDAILRHFERIEKAEKENRKVYLNEAKVLIVGKTGAGKTSIRYKLSDVNKPMPKEDESTHGVDVETIPFIGTDGRTYRMNIWDFEGQQISYQTHQFFLTRRSLYLFIIDQRTEKSDFDYWLQIVDLWGDGSPMVLFHNEKKGRICDLNLEGIQKPFEHFLQQDTHRVNLNVIAKGEKHDTVQLQKFETFRAALQEMIENLPIIQIPVDSYWLDVRKAIEEYAEAQPFIKLEEFRTLCTKHRVSEEIDQDDLSRLFHDLGIFLHYNKPEKPSLLNNMIILQRDWATKAVYEILKSEELRDEKSGSFTLSDLKAVWKNPDYKKSAGELLELMKRFELCYQIGDSSIHIAPQLLPASPPNDYDFSEGETLLLRYSYDFMPKDIITRLTVRMHKSIAREQKLAWKDGFVLEAEDAIGEVIETYGKREIHIKVTGKLRRKLLNDIKFKMDELNESYPFSDRIQVYTKIPCKCEDCIGQDEPFFHKLSQVKIQKQKGWSEIPCGNTGNPVYVDALLSDFLENEDDFKYKEERMYADIAAIKHQQKAFHESATIQREYILESVLENQSQLTTVQDSIKQVVETDLPDIQRFIEIAIQTQDVRNMKEFEAIQKGLENLNKPGSNWEVKAKIGVPFINLIGQELSIETKFDLKKFMKNIKEKTNELIVKHNIPH